MENFVFQNTTKIIFGKGTEKSAGAEIKKYSNKVLLHYGGQSIKKYGLYERVVKSLTDANIEFIELSGVQPNPVLSMVKEGIGLCRKNNIGFILAVGGGSVIDSAKAIAVGIPYEKGDVWDFFMGKAKAEAAVSIGVILTIAATGSESSVVSVILNEKTKMKKGYHSSFLLPKFAILNPELTYTLPPFQTACGSADIMSHIFERYFTHSKNTDLTDRLCESTLKTVAENTQVVLANPKNYDARAELMWAGTLAHNGLLGTGRIEDWGSHKIGHELGAVYGITHGATLSVIFPAWMKYVYRQNIGRFKQYAFRVWGVDPYFGDDESIALEGIKKLENFFKEIGLPTTLRELSIGNDKFEEMALKELQWGPIGNFMKLQKEDIINIFKLAM
ncbi:MAG: iron-containing alcohol dehydrogenase [Actinobacteria bacterium]|nr:iron-containing alcohol dehydrogenase [Actinomycetota bacterium]